MRRSSDGGKTWQNPTAIFPRQLGVNGSLALLVDEKKQLHLLFAQRIPGMILGSNKDDLQGLWYSTWLSGCWSEPEAVVAKPDGVRNADGTAFMPYETKAVIVQNDMILALWMTDPGLEGTGVWYSYMSLNGQISP